jgi:hypothetical protein
MEPPLLRDAVCAVALDEVHEFGARPTAVVSLDVAPFAGEHAIGVAAGAREHVDGVLVLEDAEITALLQVKGDRYAPGDGEPRRHPDREPEAVTELGQRPKRAVVVAALAMGRQGQRQGCCITVQHQGIPLLVKRGGGGSKVAVRQSRCGPGPAHQETVRQQGFKRLDLAAKEGRKAAFCG